MCVCECVCLFTNLYSLTERLYLMPNLSQNLVDWSIPTIDGACSSV